ncbi:MAG: ABC transporter substrate-binding protein [Janthinobacterium lividum]
MSQSSWAPGLAGRRFSVSLRQGLALASLVLASTPTVWGQAAAPPSKNATHPAPTRAASARTTVQFAKGFTIEYLPTYKVLNILNPAGRQVTPTRYALVQRGQPHPAGFPASRVIEIPIRSLVGLSSSHVALADFLDADDVLVGLGSLQYATAPKVRQRIAQGKIFAVGEGRELNNEQLIAHRPDLVMATGWPGESLSRYETLAAAGIPVLLNSEWVETTPLGRAEWVKVLAALLNKEDVVNQKFGQVAREYQRLAALGRRATQRPSVILNVPFKDTWYLPEADSYQTQYLRDAGATYHWDKTAAPGSLALTFEAVAPVALTADYWLQPGTASTKAALLAQDARFAAFKSFKRNAVYNNNLRTNAQGSNDYWESGSLRPDLVLGDLLQILHPELLPGRKLYYYQLLK